MKFTKQSPPGGALRRAAMTLLWCGGLAALIVVGSNGCAKQAQDDVPGASPTSSGKSLRDSPTASGRNGGPVDPAALMPVPSDVLNTEIKTLEGKSVRLSDYSGKVVVLDLWATWCPPCRKEIPHLIELGTEYKDRGVEVIGVTTENPQTDELAVRQFAREFGINYKVGWASTELARGILEMSGRDTIPQTLIITRDGRVIKHIIGFNPARTPESMRDAIEQAVNL